MKLIRVLSMNLSLLLCFTRPSAQAYYFANPTLVSGTALTKGATYRFTKVKPTTDALVKIDTLTGTMTLGTPLDQTTTGYDSAFQPTLVVPALSNGYVQFTITFVATGTSTPQTQTNIAATALDIDGLIVGADSLFEFDMVDMGTGDYINYNTLGGQLTITQNGTAFTGQTHTATNYPGIDTTANAVMFTVVSPSMSTMTYRTGVINKINEVPPSRVASLYFKPFVYPNSNITLPVGPLTSFSANLVATGVQLDWLLIPDNKVDTISILRSTDGKTFTTLNMVDGNVLSYRDNTPSGLAFYRIKLHQATGETTYSDIVPVSPGASGAFSVTPNPIQSGAVLHISPERAGQAVLLLVDTRGQVVLRQGLSLQKGPQAVHLDGLDRLSSGIYLAVLKTTDGVFRQKVVKIAQPFAP